MLAVLVASCPCALSLALPAVYAAASQRLLNEGILLTRGDALKALTAIDQVIFDKTGTLTSGLPLVSKVTLNPERPGLTETYVLDIAGRMESSSGHPLARAFPQTGIDLPQVQVVAGMGLQADIDGRPISTDGNGGLARRISQQQTPSDVKQALKRRSGSRTKGAGLLE